MGIPKQNKEATAFLLLRSTMSKRKGKLKVIPKDNSHVPGIDVNQSDGGWYSSKAWFLPCVNLHHTCAKSASLRYKATDKKPKE